MSESPDLCVRTTRSSIVRPARVQSARRPSSAIPRLTEVNPSPDGDDPRDALIDNLSVASSTQSMSVYLRLKPCFTKSKRIKRIKDEAYVVTNPSTLLTKFPSLEGSANASKTSKSPEAANRRFTFTRIFAPETSQSEFFDQAVKQRIVEYLTGQSHSIMTYGTTSSGKTYTLHGNAESPGIITLSIEFVFSCVNCTLSPWYKPVNLSEVQSLDEAGRRQETGVREHLLESRSIDRSLCAATYGSIANSMKEERESSNTGEAMYSVWLSFAEIYNDNVYDLLADDDNQAKLAPLRLVKDKQGRAFVQGLRMICATTGLEAYQILIAGQARLTVGSTSANPHSSRSHSIFTMKLLKYVKERGPEEVEVSTMTFCDLAGTGRLKKSTGSGNELKEAKNINTSLLVLGRCLKGVADCQMSKQNVDVGGPFRESKLTRLFQRALSGKENLTLIVNVDTSPDLYVETQAVLNFSTIAKKIIVDVKRDAKRSYGSELTIPSPEGTVAGENPNLSSSVQPPARLEVAKNSELEKLKELCASLKKENKILRETALNREYEIRQEVTDVYTGIIKELETNWRKRTEDVEVRQEDYQKWSVKQVEMFYEERIDSLTNRKRRRTSGGDEKDDDKTLFEELEAENSQITRKVIALRETVKALKEELETLSTDKNKCVFELGLAKDEIRQVRELIDEERGQREGKNENSPLTDELRSLIIDKNETIKRLKQHLDAAKNDPTKIANNTVIIDKTEPHEVTDITDNSILDSFSTEELEEELLKRNDRVLNVNISIQTEVLEESEVGFEKGVDAKFSSSTFNKRSSELAVPREYSIIEAENSMGDEETSSSMVSSRDPSMDVQTEQLTKSLRFSFFETVGRVFRSSEQSGKGGDDSGIALSNRTSSSTENSLKQETNEKGCQTSFENVDYEIRNNRDNQLIQERVEQLKLVYSKLKAEHVHETARVTELSQELESIQYALGEIKEITRKHERKIVQYQEELALREKELSSLEQAKSEMETKLIDVSQQLEIGSIAYEKKIADLSEKLRISEESENRLSKNLEENLEKSYSLERQLSVALVELDKASIRCFSEHIPKIERLEKELHAKTLRVDELDGKVSDAERDLARVDELDEQVSGFKMNFDKYQNENAELRRQLRERLESQSTLEWKLKKLMSKVHERENEISLLGTDLGNVVRMNMENNERARELSREIGEALGRLTSVKGEMTRSEDERRKLDRTSGHEIGNLIARLADFEKNAALLARIRDNEGARLDELDRVKLHLHEKEREMCLFKKNRDKTIRR